MRTSFGVVALLALAAPASAQADPFIPDVSVFAGTLDRAGAPVNATVTVAATLYDGADAGAVAVGTLADDATVVVVDGVFVLELPGLLAVVDDGRAWLELTVDGETLAPRVALGAVPWAQRAALAPWSGLSGVPAELLDGDDEAVSPGDLTAVSPVQISSSQITIRSDSVTATHLAVASVGSSEIANRSIVDDDIAFDIITMDEIASDAIGSSEMRDNAVASAEISDGSITAADLATDSVGSAELQSDAVGALELDDNAVDTNAIVNGAVTNDKLAAGAVTRASLVGAEVSVRHIDNASCEGAGGLTVFTTCATRVCGGVVNSTVVELRYYSCAGACNQSSPATCALGTIAGYLLSESIP